MTLNDMQLCLSLRREADKQRENLRYQGSGEPLTSLAERAADRIEALAAQSGWYGQ